MGVAVCVQFLQFCSFCSVQQCACNVQQCAAVCVQCAAACCRRAPPLSARASEAGGVSAASPPMTPGRTMVYATSGHARSRFSPS